MFKKTLTAACIAACGLFSMTTGVIAAQNVPTPVPAGQSIDVEPEITMGTAVATAEEAYKATSTSARLSRAHGGVYWVVRLETKDAERLVAFIDAKTGEISGARTYGKKGDYQGRYCNENGRRGHHRADCNQDDCRGECIGNGNRGCGEGRHHRRGPGCVGAGC